MKLFKSESFRNCQIFKIRKFWKLPNFPNRTILENIIFLKPDSFRKYRILISKLDNFGNYEIFKIGQFWKLLNFPTRTILETIKLKISDNVGNYQIFKIGKFWILPKF